MLNVFQTDCKSKSKIYSNKSVAAVRVANITTINTQDEAFNLKEVGFGGVARCWYSKTLSISSVHRTGKIMVSQTLQNNEWAVSDEMAL
ncbi:hypothetical protein [Gelidibacter maritimus]|uniref:Uncharacterized protein n=1 Tax=Gelidibacter maritimus TaxID=2761487 RepID=A0A7W2M2T9_9FLAO|nr:hypothetical protein [Gelidibacter maritimus]MBA6151625.1 hypothetical protein [Gelidibacter maritimus]